jgi:hypothetical protein
MGKSVVGIRSMLCWLALATLAGCYSEDNDTSRLPHGSEGGGTSELPQPEPDPGVQPEPQPEPEPEPELPPVEEPEPDDGDTGSATLSWHPPTEFTDGSTLHDLDGYRIHYGTDSGSYEWVIEIDNPGITRYVIDGLEPGTYYFAISAIASTGTESAPSVEASKTI